MKIQPFDTEHFFAQYEFSAPHLLAVSDCESMSVSELLELANVSLDGFGELELGYTESQGNPSLRRAIALSYQDVAADDIVVLGSPIEGIYLTMRTLLDPDDEAIVLTPVYDALKNLPEHIAAKTYAWPLRQTPEGWSLDWDHLATLITKKTKLLAVNFPHNPTGFLPSLDELKKLIDIAAKHGIWIYSDEMYRGLEFDSAQQLPSLAELYDKSITLSGLSKTYGLAGLRSGWLVVKDTAVKERLLNWKMYTSICPPAPTEFLTEVALSTGDKLRQRNRDIVLANLELADTFFARWENLFTWHRPMAGSVALVGVELDSATAYCHHLAKEAGVVLLPSSCLSYGDKHVRFGFGRRSFEASLAAYEQYLEKTLVTL